MKFAALWRLLAVALPLLAGLIAPLSTIDLAYQLRLGADILAGHGIPATDTFTFTAFGLPWVDQQWLAQVVLAAVYQVGGWDLLVVFHGALLGVLGGLVYASARLGGAVERSAALLAIGAVLIASPALGLRPQLLGVVLFAAVIYVLLLGRRMPRALWLVPVLVVLWVNVHGSFVLAPVVVGWQLLENAVARGRRVRSGFVALLVLTALATFVTPFGPGVWAYATGLTSDSRIRDLVTEWRPVDLVSPAGVALTLSAVFVLVVIWLRWRSARRLSWATLAWLLGLFAIAALQQRGIAWWTIGAAVAIVPLLAGEAVPERPRGGVVAVAAVVGFALIAVLPWWRSLASGSTSLLSDAPAALTSRLSELTDPGGRIRNPQSWGSWFELTLPDRQVAVDSRIELFPRSVWDDYLAVTNVGPSWEQQLERLRPDAVVVSRRDEARLLDALRHTSRWREAYSDDDGSIFLPGGGTFVRATQATIGMATRGRFSNE